MRADGPPAIGKKTQSMSAQVRAAEIAQLGSDTSFAKLEVTPVLALNPCPRLGVQGVGTQRQLRLALEEMKNSGHGGGVFGKLLALSEAENHRLQPVVVVQRAAE